MRAGTRLREAFFQSSINLANVAMYRSVYLLDIEWLIESMAIDSLIGCCVLLPWPQILRDGKTSSLSFPEVYYSPLAQLAKYVL